MEPLTGKIISWDRQKGYGYLESEGRRLFLHGRDFAEHHKRPEEGDVVTFTLGTDRKGRTCAVHAVHRDDGGRLRLGHFAFVTALLLMPGIAVWRFGPRECWFLAGWIAALSAITYGLYANDKKRSRSGAWRTPEVTLHAFALLGGWPGAFLAQRRYRHKCSRLSFQVVFWLSVGLHQFAAVDSVAGWRVTRAIIAAIRAAFSGM